MSTGILRGAPGLIRPHFSADDNPIFVLEVFAALFTTETHGGKGRRGRQRSTFCRQQRVNVGHNQGRFKMRRGRGNGVRILEGGPGRGVPMARARPYTPQPRGRAEQKSGRIHGVPLPIPRLPF